MIIEIFRLSAQYDGNYFSGSLKGVIFYFCPHFFTQLLNAGVFKSPEKWHCCSQFALYLLSLSSKA
ncbi:MAG: hypothetical protein IJM09_00110 [Neisseriaceae bacterium]|nr:hypothetical protein [Neisseriaceae bacterium]